MRQLVVSQNDRSNTPPYLTELLLIAHVKAYVRQRVIGLLGLILNLSIIINFLLQSKFQVGLRLGQSIGFPPLK